jgi:hypothetical protein
LATYSKWIISAYRLSLGGFESFAGKTHWVEKIERSLELYPCDLLFIHRDAERENPNNRRKEIEEALIKLEGRIVKPPSVCVIPVRMHEAWLLFQESAIRRASGNPNGSSRINLPRLRTVENIPDPKEVLYSILRVASEKTGRRLRQFNVHHSAGQVSEFIEDFSPLRILSAFQQLETDIKTVIDNNNWEGQ